MRRGVEVRPNGVHVEPLLGQQGLERVLVDGAAGYSVRLNEGEDSRVTGRTGRKSGQQGGKLQVSNSHLPSERKYGPVAVECVVHDGLSQHRGALVGLPDGARVGQNALRCRGGAIVRWEDR